MIPVVTAIQAPIPRRFSRADYYRFAESGYFDGERIELIDGELIEIPPIGNRHAMAVVLAVEAMHDAFGRNWSVRPQLPLSLKGDSEPQPDIAVVKGKARDIKDHPRTADLVIEISDTTLLYDQTSKASLYAKNGVADYWIVNLADNVIEVYRKPVADRARRFGHRYSDMVTYPSTGRVAPLALLRAKIKVADLLP